MKNLSDNKTPGKLCVAADTSLLQAASSYIEPYSGVVEPRAKTAFEILVTDLCRGNSLTIPLPKGHGGWRPFLMEVWEKAGGVTQYEGLEMPDQWFALLGDEVADAFAKYVEGVPHDVAKWLVFQFTPEVVREHLSRSDKYAIQRAAKLAAKLIDGQRIPRLLDAINEKHKEGFREPKAYADMLHWTEIRSLHDLCVAYALSVCLRGWSYARNLNDQAAYRHIWLRTPALKVEVSGLGLKRSKEVNENSPPVAWGTILSNYFDPSRPNKGLFRDAVLGIRENARRIEEMMAEVQSMTNPTQKHQAFDEVEANLTTLLNRVGLLPRYTNTTRPEKLSKWLKAIAKPSPMLSAAVEVITSSTLQPAWVRKIETWTRLKFRRSTFWDVFERPQGFPDINKQNKKEMDGNEDDASENQNIVMKNTWVGRQEKANVRPLEEVMISKIKIFISYAREDIEAAKRLYKDLKNFELEPWLDKESLLPGQKWKPAIESAIKNSRYFITLISKNSVSKKGYVQKEIRDALEILDEFTDQDIFIIPVRIDDSAPSHGRLKEIQWVDMFPSWKKGLDRILQSTSSSVSKRKRPKVENQRNALIFGLGNHIALLGWVKKTEKNERALKSVYNKILTILDILEFPKTALSEVEDFFRKKFEADNQEEIKITGERMLAIRDLFSMIITQRFGHDQQNIFSFGFLLTNVVYMCETPDIVPMYKDFIEENLNSA